MSDNTENSPYPVTRKAVLRYKPVESSAFGSPFESRPPNSLKTVRLTFHNRSHTETHSQRVIWADEHDNLFGSRSLKGYPNRHPRLEWSSCYPSNIMPKYLLTKEAVDQCNKASELLREHGLPTERVTEVYSLKEVPGIRGESIPINEWKEQAVGEAIRTPPTSFNRPLTTDQIKTYLKGTEFVAVLREMPVAFRILDLHEASLMPGYYRILPNGAIIFDHDKAIYYNLNELETHFATHSDLYPQQNRLLEEIRAKLAKLPLESGYFARADYCDYILDSVFRWLNVAMPIEIEKSNSKKGFQENPWQPLDVNSQNDIERYLFDFLPKRMGNYLSRFHALNIVHGFPFEHNWTLSGCLVDLDSVNGPPLGDAPVTIEALQLDLYQSI